MPDVLSRVDTELMSSAWPGGVPTRELALLRSMPEERAAKTLRRLAAVLAVEKGGNIGDLAASVGMDRHHFFRLRAGWKAVRSLRSLAPFAARKARRSGFEFLDGLAADLVFASNPGASDGELADVLTRTVGELGRSHALKAVRRAKLRLSTIPDNLSKFFGRALLIDVTAIDLPISDGRGPSRYGTAALVVERSTGLILAHASGQDHRTIDLQHEALVRSLDLVRNVDSVRQESAFVEFVAADGEDVWRLGLRDRLQGPDIHVVDVGERRFGERLVSLLGQRIGRVALRPRATGRGAEHPADYVLMENDVRALFDEAVQDFNAARLDQLIDDLQVEHRFTDGEPARVFLSLATSVPGADVGAGMMAGALRRLVDRL